MRRHTRPVALAVIGLALALIGPSTVLGQWKSNAFFSYINGPADTIFETEKRTTVSPDSAVLSSIIRQAGYPDAPGVDTAGVGTSYIVFSQQQTVVKKWLNGVTTPVIDTVAAGGTESRRVRAIDSLHVVALSGLGVIRIRIDGHKFIFKMS